MKKQPSKPALIIAILFKSRGAVGGMAQRFSLLGSKLIENGASVELLTTRSLQKEFLFGDDKPIHLIEDSEGKIPISSLIMLLRILAKIATGSYRQVHLAGAGRLLKIIIAACKISRTRLSCTFASPNLEAASYGREVDRKKWIYVLNSVNSIDVLCPIHEIQTWQEKISVSPCSFPSKRDHLPKEIPPIKEKIAVYCASLEPPKNPILALDIIHQYWKKYGEITELYIFGKGVLESEVKQKMVQINQEIGMEVIRFGTNEELPNVLQKSNIFFSLQEIDNYPSQSLMEGMLMGCKIIATDTGETRQMLPPEETLNAIIASRTASDFLPSMKRAEGDLKPSRKNIEYIQENFTIERFTQYLKTFLGEQ